MCSLHSGVWLLGVEELRSVGCGSRFCVGGAAGQYERFQSVREAVSPHTCDRGAPGTIEGVRGLRPCESRSARSGTPSVCAGGTGRAVRECACTRCACPSVLKDTSERRRRSRCPGDVTARPSDNRPVPEPSADTSGGSGGGGERGDGCTPAGPGEWESDSRSADLPDAGLPAGPREFA